MYPTTEACQSAHADCPAAVAPKGCTTATDCTIVARGCCGTCGVPHLDQVMALRKDAAASYTAAECAGNGACPPCIPGENPDFQAACIAGQCTPFDLGFYNGCTVDEECALRPSDCCDPCTGPLAEGAFVSVEKGNTGYDYFVCGGKPANCNVCPTTYPAGTSAKCDTTTNKCVISTLR
jgi:hypothetical protein